jgi:magnesium transporter
MSEVFFKRRLKTIGLPPGSLVYAGKTTTEKITIQLVRYDDKDFEEKALEEIEECVPYLDKGGVVWIHINGLHDIDLIRKTGELFDIHQLLLEDILNLDQRPKVEEYGDNLLLILKSLHFKDESSEVEIEQISILIGDRYVISFQEQEGDVFNSLRDRIRSDLGRIRKSGNDYLAYALTDAIVDNYFLILEQLSEEINQLEDEVRERPTRETTHRIASIKRRLLKVRRAVWPLREVLHTLGRGENRRISKSLEMYIRDTYDNAIQIIDAIETLRDLVSSLHDSYLSSISFQMNKVMNILTIIATIFIPLTFIAGIYGMNFKYMPELAWKLGYPIILSAMAVLGGGMFFLFKRKKWI